ncbi:hypothetical protein ACJMK2_008292 [Sinanodonta woodiana]|uniref:Poly [ADP-ribose] polymerase 12 n=1 Tax=Sinanodonta woodiana TaxID=1069815 RepID=A0ABD3VL48_SINWO
MAFSKNRIPATMLMQQQPQLSAPAGIDPNVEIVRLTLKILCSKQRPLSLMEIQSELCNQSAGGFINSQFISTLSIFQLNGILNCYPDHFALVRISPYQTAVKPQTRIELCKIHCSKNGHCPGRPNVSCNGLHICKFYILDSCKIGNCKYGHDLTTQHNMQIRHDYLLDHLKIKELKYLLNLAENRSETTFPRICKFYNNEGGCRYQQQGKSCPHLHICKHYIMDKCSFGPRCKRNHNILADDIRDILTRYKINISRTPKEIIAELQEALSKDEDSKSETSEILDQRFTTASSLVSKRCKSTPNLVMQQMSLSPYSSAPVTDSDEGSAVDSKGVPVGARIKSSRSGKHHQSRSKKENTLERQLSVDSTQGTHICLYNLRGQCWFKDSCRNVHKNMPYQWQIRYQSDGVWEDLGEEDNLYVELNFCNPECDDCFSEDRYGHPIRIFFDKMEAQTGDKKNLEVRRLSTVSSEDAENQPLATRWRWFWQDQRREWVEYGSKNMTGYQTNVVSDVIEQRYLANPKGQCQFATLGHKYIMDFNMMIQQNMDTKTSRRVKRRPEHVSPQEAKKRKLQPVQSGVLASQRVSGAGIGVKPCIVPSTWSVQHGQDLIDIFSRVEVKKKFNREEYQKVETLFMESMPSTTSIISVERIENGELWSNYHNKKDKMQRKNPGLKELNLFHGTQSQYIDAICRQGFDFRLSGLTTGTRHGKGSYFAKTAKFADRYTERGSLCIVFLVRVMAGDYTLGDKTYTRPPLKDPKDPCSDLYDSCVDNVKNPEIFVIFDNYQVYPEYVIKYNMNYTCI